MISAYDSDMISAYDSEKRFYCVLCVLYMQQQYFTPDSSGQLVTDMFWLHLIMYSIYFTWMILVKCLFSCHCHGMASASSMLCMPFHLDIIYPEELEIKYTTDSQNFSNYSDLRLEVDGNHKLSTSLFDKCNNFNFPII